MMIIHIVGARPNFMKLAPLYRILSTNHVSQKIIHTGQHFDKNMSDVFFEKFNLPDPDYNLNIHSGTHTQQTAGMMMGIENVLDAEKPVCVVVYGDVNSTLAAALVCAKKGIPLAHVEAGLRSNDRTMPEEINRIVTDRLSDILLTPSRDANKNLEQEGVGRDKIFLVGNIMIDILIQSRSYIDETILEKYPPGYGVVTLHRPSNVDIPEKLSGIIAKLAETSRKIPLIFPVHPRKRKEIIDEIKKHPEASIIVEEPLNYFELLALQKNARVVITDSGGLQEESTVLGVPCLTLRDNTERPITIEIGTNVLIDSSLKFYDESISAILNGTFKKGKIPEFWDGKTSNRIYEVLQSRFRL